MQIVRPPRRRIPKHLAQGGQLATGGTAIRLVTRRWVVERTFAWMGKYRRLSKDHEYLAVASENVIYPAANMILLHRLTGRPP
ncbi:transposase [Actinomadura rubrisoli]|uniref:transposase n=1 Tax=Actinomadura rubrisoli TaxID=2530368 RepID=UPI001FB6103E|nr:transposase [Actinomadura rubrisoli]